MTGENKTKPTPVGPWVSSHADESKEYLEANMRRVVFKHSRGSVEYMTRRIDSRFDGVHTTQEFVIVRNDGHRFRIFMAECTWICTGDKSDPEHGRLSNYFSKPWEVKEWCRKHSLPNLDWMENQVELMNRAWSEDPMGHPSQYE